MRFGERLYRLWHLRTGVAISLAVALFVGVWSVAKISLMPPSLKPRSEQIATAVTHVLVDTPSSALLDLRQNTYGLEDLTNRAVLLGNVMGSALVRTSIARRAGVPLELLTIETPLTPRQPRAAVQQGNEKKTTDIFRSTDQYRLSIQANPTVPLLDIYAQSPTADSAAKLGNAAVQELQVYLARLATTEQTPAKDQINLVQLGRAEGTVVNKGIELQVAFVAFLLTLGLGCATTIFVSRVREGWRLAADKPAPSGGRA